jgi:DNA replication and repair protein RecF
VNILVGKNGQGKTNILDGITYLCLTKGFLNSSDSSSICFGETEFEIEAEFISDINIKSNVQVHFSSNTKSKTLFLDGLKVDRMISYIGLFPIVILAPQYYSIVSGIPQDRRKFIDMVISQSSKSYLYDIMEYRKVLKQRNKLLSDIKLQKNNDLESVTYWNAPLVKYGTNVIKKRYLFIKEFIPFFEKSYKEITLAKEKPIINYFPSIETKNLERELESIEEIFERELQNCMYDEYKRGNTIVGPHKDEIGFKINEFDVRQFASQGQQKTFLVALKIAEYFYLQEKCSEKPILVLDDLFSELDRERSKALIEFLKNKCQVFISSTSSDIFDEVLDYTKIDSKFYVEEGQVQRVH